MSKIQTFMLRMSAFSLLWGAKYYASHGFNEIIHVKSAGCTPEIEIMPILLQKKLLHLLSEQFDKKAYQIVSSGTTGSARKLADAMINAGIVKNEITAHAIGTTTLHPSRCPPGLLSQIALHLVLGHRVLSMHILLFSYPKTPL